MENVRHEYAAQKGSGGKMLDMENARNTEYVKPKVHKLVGELSNCLGLCMYFVCDVFFYCSLLT